MFCIFATLLLALLLGWLGRDRYALGAIAATFVLAIWLFLFEIYSPEYGFRMPWISTQAPLHRPACEAIGMSSTATSDPLVTLNHVFLLLMLAVIAGILSAAMTMQFVYGELPCPLCLLERVALFGVAFGIMLNFRHGFTYRNTGISLLFAIFLLVVSTRQTLLDIYPRPGHAYIGSAVFGLHMPVWSILIALAILTGYALKLIALGNDDHVAKSEITSRPLLSQVANILSVYVVALCAINFAAVFLQCGLSECHTDAYALLK